MEINDISNLQIIKTEGDYDNGLSESEKKQLSSFNSISKKISKKIEAPNSISRNSIYSTLFSTGYNDYSAEEIERIKQNIDVSSMRRISNYFYNANSSYKRIIDSFSNLFLYYYTLDLKNISTFKNKKQLENIYNQSLLLLDNLYIKRNFPLIAQKVLVDGCYFGFLSFEDNQTSLTRLDPNYCRSRLQSYYGTSIVEFDIRYFDRYQKEERDKILKKYPKIIRQSRRDLDEGLTTNYFVPLPPEESCAFMLNDFLAPPLFDTILDIINFNDYKKIEKQRDTQELQKLLVQQFKMDPSGNLNMLMEEMASIHEAVSEILMDKPNIDVITTIADNIKLEDTQSTNTSARNNIEKMVVPKYENAGISYELFASTSSTALEYSVNTMTSFMMPLIEEMSNWLTLVLFAHINYRTLKPIVTILPVTIYNKQKMFDNSLKAAQYGYSLMLPYILLGKSQSTLIDCKFLENEVLNLTEILKPLSSAFTKNGEETISKEDSGKQNIKSQEEKSEKTIQNIESK